MDLLSLFIAVILLCVCLWAVQRLMAAFGVGDPLATVIYVLVVVIFVLWLLSALGVGISSFSLRGHQ